MISVQIVPFIMAVVFHEYAHGLMAYKCGDETAKRAGRLTMNPLPHLDPIGTVLFPLINMISGINLLFGWARPVPINPNRFKNYRRSLFLVAFAGPGMNIIIALFSAAAFCAIRLWVPGDFYLYEPLLGMSYISVSLNFALAIFNLIPLPPLDGSKLVQSFLSYEATQKYESLSRYSFFILMALLLSGGLNVLSHPIKFMTDIALYAMAFVFRMPEVM